MERVLILKCGKVKWMDSSIAGRIPNLYISTKRSNSTGYQFRKFPGLERSRCVGIAFTLRIGIEELKPQSAGKTPHGLLVSDSENGIKEFDKFRGLSHNV
jgi:hypothetical protein